METDETIEPTPNIATDSPSLPQPNAPRHLTFSTRLLWGVIAFVPLFALTAAISVSTRVTTLMFGALALVWSALCLIFVGSYLFQLPINTTRRNIWVIAMLVAAPVALPVFWWTKILNAPKSSVQHT